MNTRSQTTARLATATATFVSQERGNNQDEHEQNAESKVHDPMAEVTGNLHKMSFGEPRESTKSLPNVPKISFGEPRESTKSLPKITSSKQLKKELPAICNEVSQVLGLYNLEATYQRALALELRERGVTVLSEVEIPIVYKGQKVGTRRVDLYLILEKVVILELKAVATGLKAEHTKQLKFYMTHFNVNEGYLINFPHLTGFPEENSEQYVDHPLQGPPVSDVTTRSKTARKAEEIPSIIHVKVSKTGKKTSKEKHSRKTSSKA
ncbi:hypothetical protein P3T76_005993 [Phytophthora citrophthora]|uniref:GxxExxY protein n=1 Tax=Phytophthora citrophthora TaxID=4793 RepID=A0AAD9GPD4_9STRA|nr:hypothetical protein P3T76_005993 [Phytophthora citrophthora]